MAVTISVGDLAIRTRVSTTTDLSTLQPGDVAVLTDALASSTAIVETRAPAAPETVQNQAVVHIVAYWLDAPFGAPARFGYDAFLNSGAGQLLAPYIVRRAEAV